MMTDQDLTTRIRELADQDGVGPAPVDRLIAEGRRARRARTVRLTGVTTGVMAAVIAAALSIGGLPGQSTSPVEPFADKETATIAIQPPKLRLAAAAAASAGQSFTFKVTSRYEINGPGRARDETWVDLGALDPVHRNGFLRARDVPTAETRMINGEVYQFSRVWFHAGSHGKGFGVGGPHVKGAFPAGGLSGNPADQLAALRELGNVSDPRPVGGVDRYRYSYVIREPYYGRVTVAGEVDVTRATGTIARISHSIPLVSPRDSKGFQAREKWTLTFEFSDYGTPVRVEKPPVR